MQVPFREKLYKTSSVNNGSKGALSCMLKSGWLEYKLSGSCLLFTPKLRVLFWYPNLRASTKKGLLATTATCRSLYIVIPPCPSKNLTVPCAAMPLMDIVQWCGDAVHGYTSSKSDTVRLPIKKPLGFTSASLSDPASSRSDCQCPNESEGFSSAKLDDLMVTQRSGFCFLREGFSSLLLGATFRL